MSKAKLSLEYNKLSDLIENEINKRDIEFKNYPIKLKDLTIQKQSESLSVSSKILSKWNASFKLSFIPLFNPSTGQFQLEDLSLKLNSKNIIFKGILKLLKSHITKKIEELSTKPFSHFSKFISKAIDDEINQSKMPFDLNVVVKTINLSVENLEFSDQYILTEVNLDQKLDIELDDSIKLKTN